MRRSAFKPSPGTSIAYAYFDSPVGRLLIAGDGERLHLISFASGSRTRHPEQDWRKDEKSFKQAFRQLDQYFSGKRRNFDLPLHFAGTPFQNTMWKRLLKVPYGTTTTYLDLAIALGRPAASRAVGAANGANPFPIVVPCHRVLGSNGSLTGFGGGVDVKRFLLVHEHKVAGQEFRLTGS